MGGFTGRSEDLNTPFRKSALVITLSGCASNTDDTVTTTGTMTTTTTSALSNETTDYTCTAEPGGVVGGGANGVRIAGCTMTLGADGVFASSEIPSGCDLSYDDTGDGLSDGAPSVGTKYESGTDFLMGCDATNPTATGIISFTDA